MPPSGRHNQHISRLQYRLETIWPHLVKEVRISVSMLKEILDWTQDGDGRGVGHVLLCKSTILPYYRALTRPLAAIYVHVRTRGRWRKPDALAAHDLGVAIVVRILMARRVSSRCDDRGDCIHSVSRADDILLSTAHPYVGLNAIFGYGWTIGWHGSRCGRACPHEIRY